MGSAIDLTLRCSAQVPPSDGVVFPGGYHESLRKAKEYLQCLEDERRKVEGFKRELPISIKLLEDAIRACKEKLASARDVPALQLSCSSMDSEKERCSVDPTLEEFLPSKRRWSAAQQSDGDNVEPERTKRPAWMTEGRLWNQSSTSTRACHEEKEKECVDPEQSCVTSSQLPFGSSKEKTSPGAFLPFLKEHPDVAAAAPPSLVSRPTPTMAHNGVGLSLSFGDLTTSPGSSAHIGLEAAGTSTDLEVQIQGFKDGTSCDGSSPGAKNSKRKARRCWAPELHRRFVSALHQLGGAEVATPKQICELMKVDGLTNDEVKSHLQKYRLHTRRPGSSPQLGARGAHSPQLVVLGGIWVPPKCPQAAPSAAAVYDSSTGHLSQLNFQAAPPQNHYFACISNGAAAVAAAAPVQMHRQAGFHEPQQAASQSQSSPQGSLQVTSQFSEATQGPNSEVYRDDNSGSEEEEAKSDSTSWQNESYSSGEKKLKKSSSEQCTSH